MVCLPPDADQSWDPKPNTMKADRKQWQYIHGNCLPSHVTHVTPAHAFIWGGCILMLPVLELATEHVQLTTTCHMNPINRGLQSRMNCSHTPLVLPSFNNVLPAMVLQNRVNIKCLSSHSSVCHVSLSSAPTFPTGLGRRVVGVVVLLLLLMSGDIEMNLGPFCEWLFLMYRNTGKFLMSKSFHDLHKPRN